MFAGEQDVQMIQRAAVAPRRLESLEATNQTETGGAPAPAGSITNVYNAMEVKPIAISLAPKCARKESASSPRKNWRPAGKERDKFGGRETDGYEMR